MADRQRVRPDDEVYRVRAVWLGPKGLTLPFAARYVSWLVGIMVFVGLLTTDSLIFRGFQGRHFTWNLALAILLAYLIMQVVDHERPFWAHVRATKRELSRIARRKRRKAVAADVVLRVAVGPKRQRITLLGRQFL